MSSIGDGREDATEGGAAGGPARSGDAPARRAPPPFEGALRYCGISDWMYASIAGAVLRDPAGSNALAMSGLPRNENM